LAAKKLRVNSIGTFNATTKFAPTLCFNISVGKMKKVLSLVLLVVASSTLADDWPTRPFTFVGIPEKIRSETYETIHGKMRNMVIRVVEVKEGSYEKPEIGFDFPAGSKPPLEIGETYLFKAVYDRHGIRYTDWTKMPQRQDSALPDKNRGARCNMMLFKTLPRSRKKAFSQIWPWRKVTAMFPGYNVAPVPRDQDFHFSTFGRAFAWSRGVKTKIITKKFHRYLVRAKTDSGIT
jgi:hypothetical protein